MHSDGVTVAVDRRFERCSGARLVRRGIACSVGSRRHFGKGIRLGRFDRRDGLRRRFKHDQDSRQGICIAVEFLGRHRCRRQVRPSVAHGLQFPDPGAPLARQTERLRQLIPILLENTQQGGEIQLVQRGEAPLPHGTLLLKAQAVFHVGFPPSGAEDGQVLRKEPCKLGSCSTNQMMHEAGVDDGL